MATRFAVSSFDLDGLAGKYFLPRRDRGRCRLACPGGNCLFVRLAYVGVSVDRGIGLAGMVEVVEGADSGVAGDVVRRFRVSFLSSIPFLKVCQ